MSLTSIRTQSLQQQQQQQRQITIYNNFHNNNNSNNNISPPVQKCSVKLYYSSSEDCHKSSAATTTTTTTPALPLNIAGKMCKSNSYHGTVSVEDIANEGLDIPRAASLTGRVSRQATTEEETVIVTPIKAQNSEELLGEGLEEYDTLLAISTDIDAAAKNGPRRGSRRPGRPCACPRTLSSVLRPISCYASYLLSFAVVCAFLLLAYCTRDYARRLLFWIETQNSAVIFWLFVLFFVLVSFPVVFGYFVLTITSGYLFGCIKGLLTVIFGANLGIAIAHTTISSCRQRIPMHHIIKNETGRAILRVISGPRAFRVVLFTRLTPIPFGLQNAIFGISTINPLIYHTATFFGLMPAQLINVYLGSTLRSMHEVLNSHSTAFTGYLSIGFEIICGVGLMFWVVQKARKELSETLLSDMSTEAKLVDIQV